jgi:hypothetical protein
MPLFLPILAKNLFVFIITLIRKASAAFDAFPSALSLCQVNSGATRIIAASSLPFEPANLSRLRICKSSPQALHLKDAQNRKLELAIVKCTKQQSNLQEEFHRFKHELLNLPGSVERRIDAGRENTQAVIRR